MRVLIPPDFEPGQELTCFQVYWPDTPYWRYILSGLLSYPTRGRFWDERSGTIKTAQAIGLQIWHANMDLEHCGGKQPENGQQNGLDGQIDGLEGAGNSAEECEEMPAITWLSVEDGTLYMHFGPCCKIPVDNLADIRPGGFEPDDLPTPDPEVTAACRKAYVVGTTLWDMAETFFDAWYANLGIGLLAYNQLKNAYPDVSWDYADILVANAILTALAPVAWVVGFSDQEKQKLICQLALQYDNTFTLSDAEFSLTKTIIRSTLGVIDQEFLVAVFNAAGPGDWKRIAQQSAFLSDDPDCNCPGTTFNPTGAWLTEWDRFVDLTTTDPSTVGITLLSGAVYTAGTGVQSDPDDGNGFHTPGIEWDILNPSADNTITHVWFAYTAPVDMDYSDGPKSNTDDETLIAGGTKPDGDPSRGGKWNNYNYALDVPTLNRQWVRWEAKGYNPVGQRELSDSWTLTHIAIGGEGVDPFIAP